MNRATLIAITLGFTTSLGAPLLAGCAAAPAEEEESAMGETALALTAKEAAGGEASLTCPGAGTCQKASDLCGTPNSASWCSILSTCMSCYPDGWLTGEPAASARAEVKEATRVKVEAPAARPGTSSLTCPASGTCDKASNLCGAPNSESWCSILSTCYACGYPY